MKKHCVVSFTPAPLLRNPSQRLRTATHTDTDTINSSRSTVKLSRDANPFSAKITNAHKVSLKKGDFRSGKTLSDKISISKAVETLKQVVHA